MKNLTVGYLWLWIEAMILKLSVLSQQSSHLSTWKFSGVFNCIRTHDLCDVGAGLICEKNPKVVQKLWGSLVQFISQQHFANFHSSFLSQEHMCSMCTGIAEVMGSSPVEDTRNFSGAHMRRSLRLSRKCEDHCFSHLSATPHKHFFYPIWGY